VQLKHHKFHMPVSSKPRKKYKPKGIIKDPLKFVLDGIRVADTGMLLSTKIMTHQSMLALTTGQADKQDWQFVANAVNVGLVLCEQGYGKEFVGDLVQAQVAMTLLRDRYKATGRFILRAEEMKLINEALALHDEQLDLAPVMHVAKAAIKVERELSRGNFVRVVPISPPPPSLPQLLAA